MANLKTTTVAGKLSVIGRVETGALTVGSKTVTGISDTISNDSTQLATAKAVYDYVTKIAGENTVTDGVYSASASASALSFSLSGTTLTASGTATGTATIITAGYLATGSKSGTAAISGTYTIPTETKSCTPSTSAQDISPSSGKFLTKVSVGAISTETKSCTPSTSAQDITPSSGKYLTKVSVSAIPTETKTASSSGDVTPSSGKYLTKVSVPSAAPKFDGGGISGGGLSQSGNSGGGLSASGSNATLSDTNNGISVTVTRAAFSNTVTRAKVTRAAVLYNGAVNGWVSVSDNTSASGATELASTTSKVSLASDSVTKYISGVSVPSGKSFSVSNAGTTTITADTGTTKYLKWTIAQASNGDITFTYSG